MSTLIIWAGIAIFLGTFVREMDRSSSVAWKALSAASAVVCVILSGHLALLNASETGSPGVMFILDVVFGVILFNIGWIMIVFLTLCGLDDAQEALD